MAAIEGGAIANGDEQRQVGHYWLRHPQLAPDPEVQAHIATEIDQIEALVGPLFVVRSRHRTARLYGCAWIGIGGSSLGPCDDPGFIRGGCGLSIFSTTLIPMG